MGRLSCLDVSAGGQHRGQPRQGRVFGSDGLAGPFEVDPPDLFPTVTGRLQRIGVDLEEP